MWKQAENVETGRKNVKWLWVFTFSVNVSPSIFLSLNGVCLLGELDNLKQYNSEQKWTNLKIMIKATIYIQGYVYKLCKNFLNC